MAGTNKLFKTWGGNKSVRMRGFDYSLHVPYHIVIRAWKTTMPFHNPNLAAMTCELLVKLFTARNAYLAAYCLMPDHLHVLMSPNESGLTVGQLIGQFKGLTTNQSWQLGWKGRLWQDRFYDHVLRRGEDIAAVARYIYENPERKRFSGDYRFRWAAPGLA
jgi:putative transposase